MPRPGDDDVGLTQQFGNGDDGDEERADDSVQRFDPVSMALFADDADNVIAQGAGGDYYRRIGSLVSWIHDGSHHVDDGVFAPVTDEVVEKYLAVFQRIFEVLGHTAHYEMMMRDVVEDGRQIVRV